MKKKLGIFFGILILFALFLSPLKTYAQTATTPSNLKQNLMDIRKERQEAVKKIQAQIQTLRDQFKQRLTSIKDARKRSVVERLDRKIEEMNIKHTERFSDTLNKLQALLDKTSSTATDQKLLDNIKIAQTAIDTANTAVANQASKVYIIQISEANLKLNVGATVSQFRLDLMQVHKLVVEAKQAVQKLNPIKNITEKEATKSGSL